MAKSITINNKEYNLIYGMEFVRQLDAIAGEKVQGMSQGIGFGLGMTVARLEMGEFAPEYVFKDIIKAATATLIAPPKDDDIEDFIYDVIYKDDKSFEKYKDSFLESFEKSKACQRQMKKLSNLETPETEETTKKD